MNDTPEENTPPLDFIRQRVADDVAAGKNDGRVVTRFPPEPNGFLHLGHAKAICLNFGLASEYEGGVCHMRFDDTNPTREDAEYVDSILDDVRWLGWDWGENLFYASDYFDQLYEYALVLIRKGKAFVCDLDHEEMAAHRGTVQEPGRDSPHKSRSVEENLDLFERMRAGEFEEGSRTLRANIDMASDNMVMRDPVIYRIMKVDHHRTGDKWCIYPMYDFTHGLSDSIEKVTHSLCSLEFQVRRPLYDWFIDEVGVECHPQQIEFARLNLTYTVMSKRKLLELVEGGQVEGWDDPRLPTICGLRRRGYTPASIRTFCERIGMARRDNTQEIALLEHGLRDELNRTAERRMGVLRPLKVIIDNYPEGESEELEAINNPEDESAGKRKVPFSRELWIEQTDFMEDPPKKFFRLGIGREVRLRYAYYITCVDVVKDDAGEVVEVHCTYDPETRGGDSPDGRKVKGTIHWVSAQHAVDAEVRVYDHLFMAEDPLQTEDGGDWKENLNPDSLEVLAGCKLEPSLGESVAGDNCQFERHGYFCVDPVDSAPGQLVFNRTASLRDAWARLQKRGGS
ncbi:MAG: glutamine--tRNA ligase/YqeY domain fusion protein [Planctomycetota bacterium]|nr:glutamine--tRNA ligase/YqeY domain fusion protein [Planctomycetota bacterium]